MKSQNNKQLRLYRQIVSVAPQVCGKSSGSAGCTEEQYKFFLKNLHGRMGMKLKPNATY